MYSNQRKKTAIFYILEILKKYTDSEHTLNQKEIQSMLEKEFDIKLNRKAIKPNLTDLIDLGFDINYRECVRKTPSQGDSNEDNVIFTDFYINRDFTDSELRLLIDSIMFSNHIPYKQDRQLIEKLSSLSNIYFKSKMNHVTRMPDNKTDNNSLFLNIEILDEAISQNKKISFKYLEYRNDKKLYYRNRSDGTIREYTVNPYQLAAKDGKYYLICNNDKYDSISNYRVDRIADIVILNSKRKPFESLKDSNGDNLDIKEYMEKHIYMFSGKSSVIQFKADKTILSDIIDTFGKNIRITDNENDKDLVIINANINEMAMEQFAKTYIPFVEIISPKHLRDKMTDNLQFALKKYDNEKE